MLVCGSHAAVLTSGDYCLTPPQRNLKQWELQKQGAI